MRTDIDELRKQHEEEEAMKASFGSPFKKWVEHVFSDMYPGSSYRKTSLTKMKDDLVTSLMELQKTESIHTGKYISKINSCKDKESILLYLEEQLFSLQ